MPSRVIREGILTSEKVNALSDGAELFYRRLMSVVDDFGRFTAHPSRLRAACFEMRLDRYTEAQVNDWLRECVEAGLVATYEVKGEFYLEFLNFGQRTRIMKCRWPLRPNERLVISDGEKGGKVYEIKRLTNDGHAPVMAKTDPPPKNDGHLTAVIPIPDTDTKKGGEGKKPDDGQMTVIPVFEPVKLGLYRREYEAMIADCNAAIKAMRGKAENYAKDLSKAAEDLIAFLETQKPENWQARANEVYERPDSYERKTLKPKPAAVVDAWNERIKEIKKAMSGIRN